MKLSATIESIELNKPFGISRGTKTAAEVLRVRVVDQGVSGFGEAVPYPRYQDTPELAVSQISALDPGLEPSQLLSSLPPGSARNALDAALLDLRAQQSAKPTWQLLGLSEPRPIPMCYTISLKEIDQMVQDAVDHADLPVLKIKLGGKDDQQVIVEIAKAAPKAELLVDVNEGWSLDQLENMIPYLLSADVKLLEQPTPANLDGQLETVKSPIPLCADESISPGMEISQVSPAYSFVNLKLDKSGGLTTALSQLNQARQRGFGVMVGCMVGTSLAMAPAYLLAQQADFVDLDGFLHVAQDHIHPLRFQDGLVSAPPELWGSGIKSQDR